jgi:hypothetical protein
MSRICAPYILFGATLAAALSVTSAHAHAQGADAATALTLFEEGKQLAAAGNFAEGCPKLLASYNVVPKLGTLLNLADCYERAGKTASAWVRFTEAVTMAERAGQQERTDFARTHAASLAPKLSRLVITVSGARPDGLEVRRDGALVDAAAFGTPVPVDPGTHVLEARAPHKKTWTTNVEIAAAATEPRAVAVPVLEPDGAAGAAGASPVAGAASTTEGPDVPADSSTTSSRGSSQRTWAFVVGGVGGAGLVASLVTGLIAKNQYAHSNDPGGCVNDACTQRGLDDRSTAASTAGASTGIFVGGALLLATGVVLYLTAPSSSSSPSPASASSRR